ncbi:MAG: hypothetical protein HKP61_15250 [Dactylosporangium sp.]|nr:hypothetical protein [Dactylosporangium sp.]NNJ62266.1 hypothetical protein [Dactylosporangium sp.]
MRDPDPMAAGASRLGAGRLGADRLGILARYAAARRRRFRDRAHFERWQAARLYQALSRARRVFPYYAEVPAPELWCFPIVDKSLVTAHFAHFNDRGLALADCLALARRTEAMRDFTAGLAGVSIGLSSGTSGRQSVFLTSPAERRTWAGTILAKALPDGLWAGARAALILRAGGPLYESVGGGRVAFRYFDLAVPLSEHHSELDRFAPTILAAPPQALVLLAHARRKGILSIAPGRIFSIAEVLDPHDQSLIESTFGVRVDQIYQATEGFLGISCAYGRLHLNEDLLVFEREPVGPGRFTPIVTDLYRRTQAVIRLRLDDVLVEAPDVGPGSPCACGSVLTVIERVEGRRDDILLLPHAPHGERAAPATPPGTGAEPGAVRPLFADFVRAAILAAPGVQDFRVVQDAPDLLHLAVRPASAQAAATDALRALISHSGLRIPRIEPAAFTPGPAVVKLRRVQRTFQASTS